MYPWGGGSATGLDQTATLFDSRTISGPWAFVRRAVGVPRELAKDIDREHREPTASSVVLDGQDSPS